MQRRKLIIFFVLFFICTSKPEAQNISYTEADSISYDLYLHAKWNELIDFGKVVLKSGQDFPMLRLRIGYAALMKENYSDALKHYDAILKIDSYNQTALYYNWYCRYMLDQNDIANAKAANFSKEILKSSGIKKYKLGEISSENSFKSTNITNRGNSLYNRISIKARLGWKFNIEQSLAFYNQTINEPALVFVDNNQSIKIPQKEYYAKLSFNINTHFQLIGVYHNLNTPFNNYNYNNHIGLIGIQYFGYKTSLQAEISLAKLADTNVRQMNLKLTYYPKGNMNSYFISVISLTDRNNARRINCKEIAGLKILKNIWVEGNVTLNKFSNYLENDALYVFNAIDENKFKTGINAYIICGKHLELQTGYTFETRKLYNLNYIYNQNSINGGITWKF